MTFPFSTHNYHLRFWMAAGGVDPDEDVRLVVLPPPYMVESLANGHVDAFCVGAPWNSVAVDLGIGHILHFVSEILAARRREGAGGARAWAEENPDVLRRLVRAHRKAAAFIEDVANRDEVAAILSAPNRIGVAPEVIRRTLDGRLKVAPDGTVRDQRPLSAGRPRRRGAARSGAGGVALCADGALGPGAAVGRVAGRGARRCSGLTSTTRRSDRPARIRRASRPTASAPSPGRLSTPTTSPATSRAWTIRRSTRS